MILTVEIEYSRTTQIDAISVLIPIGLAADAANASDQLAVKLLGPDCVVRTPSPGLREYQPKATSEWRPVVNPIASEVAYEGVIDLGGG